MSDAMRGRGDEHPAEQPSADVPAADVPSDGDATPGATLDVTQDGTPPAPPAHQETGLELARSITRATLGAGVTPRRRRRSPGSRPDRRTARGRVSGAFPDERDPKLLEDTVSRLVADHGWSLDLKVSELFGRWRTIVGDDVAAHSVPESFGDGKLLVRTDSTAWATQLGLLAPTIVRRLNEELGDGTVRVIDVQGPAAPSWRRGLRSVRGGRGPRDTYG